MRNDHSQHRRGQPNVRGPQGQGGGRRRSGGNPQQGGQGYSNPNTEPWGARGYGAGGGDQGVERWQQQDDHDDEMDRGQYAGRLGHGDESDWRQDDQAFGGEFIQDEPSRYPGGQGHEPGGRGYGMGGYGTHGGGNLTTGAQWGSQGGQGVGSYGGPSSGAGGGPGSYYGQGHREGGTLGGSASGGMGWRGEASWQGGEREQQQRQRYEPGPKGYRRSDERIKEDVSDRISQMQHVDSSDVEVQVNAGEVTLTGTVPNRIMKWQLENLVESIGGVSDVNNQLRVRREGGFMQQVQSTAKSVVDALKPNEPQENARRGSVPTTGSQDAGPVTRK